MKDIFMHKKDHPHKETEEKQEMENPEECQEKSCECEKQEEEKKQLNDQLKRAVADYRNLEARIEKEKANFVRYVEDDTVKKILPVLDNLEKAQAAKPDQGIQLIQEQLQKIIDSFGITEIEAMGKKFDPNFHDCIEVVEGPENEITAVLEKGYVHGEKVVRPAKVKVGKVK
jgi:molecular chaperone GrpE